MFVTKQNKAASLLALRTLRLLTEWRRKATSAARVVQHSTAQRLASWVLVACVSGFVPLTFMVVGVGCVPSFTSRGARPYRCLMKTLSALFSSLLLFLLFFFLPFLFLFLSLSLLLSYLFVFSTLFLLLSKRRRRRRQRLWKSLNISK